MYAAVKFCVAIPKYGSHHILTLGKATVRRPRQAFRRAPATRSGRRPSSLLPACSWRRRGRASECRLPARNRWTRSRWQPTSEAAVPGCHRRRCRCRGYLGSKTAGALSRSAAGAPRWRTWLRRPGRAAAGRPATNRNQRQSGGTLLPRLRKFAATHPLTAATSSARPAAVCGQWRAPAPRSSIAARGSPASRTVCPSCQPPPTATIPSWLPLPPTAGETPK